MRSGQYSFHYRIPFFDDLHNYFPEILYGSPTRFNSVNDVLTYIRNQVRWHADLFGAGHDAYSAYQNRIFNAYGGPFNPHTPPGSPPSTVPVPPPAAAPPVPQQPAPPVPQQPAPPVPQQPAITSWFSSLSSTPSTSQSVSPPNGIVPLPPAVPLPSQQQTILRRRIPPRPQPLINPNLNTITGLFNDEDMTFFDNLMNIFTNPGNMAGRTTIHYIGTDLGANLNNLSPVPVNATREQIADATTIMNAANEHVSQQCMVCLEHFVLGQELRKINHCNHIFHKSCIDTWFEMNVRCPMCRYDIRGEEAEAEEDEDEDEEEEEEEEEEYNDGELEY